MPKAKAKKDDVNTIDPAQVQPAEEPDAVEALTAAHPVPEDPEEHIGDTMTDPWSDEAQTDWPNSKDNS